MKYRVKDTGGRYIKTGRDSTYVMFTFGSCAFVGFNRYLGYSREDCIRIRSNDIESYYDGNGVHKLK